MPDDRPDLQDLIENPPERLDVELKDWIDIANDRVARAKIARHLAALANHGGGYLVFGFDDSRTANPSLQFPLKTFERDNISSIVQTYLTPTFQCEVYLVTSRTGITHPVVWVPSHGAIPVCSKADGPHDQNGRPQGSRWLPTTFEHPGRRAFQLLPLENRFLACIHGRLRHACSSILGRSRRYA
jgi:hypothetical protein